MPSISGAHAFSSCSTARPRSYPRQHEPDWNASRGDLYYEARSFARRRRPDRKTQKQSRCRLPSSTHTSRPWQSLTVLMWGILFGLLLYCPGADAEYVQIAKPLAEGRSTLLFDRSERPIPAPRIRLEKRQEQGSISATPSFIPAPTAAGQASSSLFGIQTATGSPRDDLPTPFDTSLGNNFTASSCPAFFQSFLSNSTFQDCLPFSLLLQTSNSFFTATRSLVRLTQTLDATCNVPDFPKCAAVMSDLATQIQITEHCGEDFDMENPMVRQAYAGFVAYQPLYHAGCLTNDNGDYCFAAAVTNASTSSSAYVYYMPLGVSLPATAKPACNSCLRNTMSIFALYASDSTQPLGTTYSSSASQLDDNCGAQFVEAARVSSANAAGRTTTTAGLSFSLTLFMISLHFIL